MELVRNGRDSQGPLVERPRIDRNLSPEQMAAVTHALSSTDQLMAIRGQAGVGKSFLLKSLVQELHRNDMEPVALAPTVAASRGALREAGLDDANTLAMFLSDSTDGKALRDTAKNGLIVLDEAGLTSTPDMLRLVEKANELDARVLLVGDTRQLASVERGDALRLLEDDGLLPAELKEIHRQKNNPDYKAVVEEMAKGNAAQGLRDAKEKGFVSEILVEHEGADDSEAYDAKADRLAAEAAAQLVAKAYENERSNIVVAPTHALGRTVTEAIRQELQAKGYIGEDVATVSLLRQVDRCMADRRDAPHALEEGDLVILRRDDETRDLSMGEVLHARADDRGKVYLFREDETESRVAAGLDPRAYAVFRSEDIPLAVGDQVRAFEPMADMQRGDRGTIESIDHWARTITLEDGRAISMDSKYLGHGYVVTAPGSQGQSVDHAIVVATTSSLPAMSKESLYVASSRGKEHLDIITDDFDALQDAARRSVQRAHGVDVAKEAHVRELVEQGRLSELDAVQDDILKTPAPVVDRAEEPSPMPMFASLESDEKERVPALVAAGKVSELQSPPASSVNVQQDHIAEPPDDNLELWSTPNEVPATRPVIAAHRGPTFADSDMEPTIGAENELEGLFDVTEPATDEVSLDARSRRP